MTKRSNLLTRVIEQLDAKIDGLRQAREVLVEQQQQHVRTAAKGSKRTPDPHPAEKN